MNASVVHRTAMAILLAAAVCQAGTAPQMVRRGNDLYVTGDWRGAIEAYEKAIADEPAALVPRFNRANALFRDGDFTASADAYRQVAAESREISLVAKAKYNLGNSLFEEGMRHRDSDLKKSADLLKQAIAAWREAIELEPANTKALRNIEVAKLVIKDIIDEQKKKQELPEQDPNNAQQQCQQNQDPNDPNQTGQKQQDRQNQDPNDPNQAGQQQQEQQQQEKEDHAGAENDQQQNVQEKKDAPDATAEEILRAEGERKKRLQPTGYVPVEKDW